MDIVCQECSAPFPDSQDRCPHCCLPSLFPNVTVASRTDERDELDVRYRQACVVLSANNCDAVRQQFETEIRSRSKIVISMCFNELERLAQADTNVFSTFYQRVQAGLQIPKGGKWDVLRSVAEHAVFPGYKDHIRFGALSLDGIGVKNYGECSIEMKAEMVTHRTTLFEDNNVVFTVYEQRTTMAGAEHLPCGHRAVWEEREKLCVAKLASRLHSGLKVTDFSDLLLEQGATTRDDRFVELHIWGSLTIRSVQRVRIHREHNRPPKVLINDLQRLLKKKYNVDVI